MLSSAPRAVAFLALFLSIVVHSFPSPSVRPQRRWLANQINETMCWWIMPRSGVIRDTMYLDGGYLAFLPGLADGTYAPSPDAAPRQVLYSINFNQPFNTSQNFSNIILTQAKPDGNLALNYYDGTMFANDYEFYLFGGLVRTTDSETLPDYNQVLGYEQIQYGPYRQSWAPGWNSENLPDGMTRYIYGGAGVNIPSENLGYYLSGLHGPNWGDIQDFSIQYKGNISANTLLSVDMSVMRSEKWTNDTLPSGIEGRAGAELVWIPVSSRGVLVAIGGVINPEYDNFLTDAQKLESQTESPAFMKTVSVYDVNGRNWYTQDTTGDIPGALTQLCSVVASAKDGSSYSVYIYGGYTGTDVTESYSDDVYILSIPSFIWTKVYTGTTTHGRIRHKCSKPYPDQMFVVGGAKSSDPTDCLDGGMIQIFNLNSLTWQTSYDPNVWSEYKVPSVVVSKIGGTGDGGATTASPSTWGDNALPGLFGAKYTKTIVTYYPYNSVPATTTGATPSRPTLPLPTPTGSKGVPSWVAPVLGVVLGLVAISAIVTCALLYKRRKLFGKSAASEGSQSGLNHRIMSWMGATPLPAKASTVATTEDLSVSGVTPLSANDEAPDRPPPTELHSQPVFEMPANERPAEVSASETATRPPMRQVSFASGNHANRGEPRSPQGIPRSESPTAGTSPPISPQQRARHSHTISDVSANSDLASPERDRPSPLGYTPEVREHNPIEATVTSPVSPPTDERGNPIDRDDQRLSPTVRGHQDSPTRRTSQFGENF